MKLVIGTIVASAALIAACGDGSSDSLTNARKNGSTSSTPTEGTTTDPTTGTTSQPVATNSPAGKAFYKASVHPILQATCGTCHSAAGPGPAWFTPTDSEQSYAQLFQAGYVVQNSRITTKGAHDGSTTNVLNADQITTYNKWVAMELADGGEEAPPTVLAKFGTCFDQTLFDAMKMGDWRPTPRNDQNKPATFTSTQWNENQNTCTGCRSACYTCHSQGESNYINAIGQAALPATTTYESTKVAPYISKFFAVSPDGKPIASDSIKLKQDSTMKQGRDTHPLLNMTTAQMTAIKAFTDDAIAKYTAGTCGK